jgi:hypothetical protein
MISPVYFIHGGKWHISPGQEIGVRTVMKSRIEFDSVQDILDGALVYKIQRKHAESDEFIQDESKNIQLLIAWRGDHTKGLDVRVLLVEQSKKFNWDEDKLKRLYQKYWHPLDAWVDFIGNNWLLDDATVLGAEVDAMNGGYRWDIHISERKEASVIERPLWIDAERWVSMMSVIYLILTCIVSLTLHMPMDVTVHNQHSGIELTSPIGFCDGRIYKEYSVERMGGGAVLKISTRFGLLDKFPGGILMCEVQKKENTGSDHQSSTNTTSSKTVEGTSKIMRLLVIWEVNLSGRSRTCTILVEHDNDLILNENKLAQLYNKVNNIPFKAYNWILKYDDIYKWVWLISDNTVLEATDDIIYEKGCELKITISEGVEDENAASAFWIDSTRQVPSLIVIYFS